MLSLKVTLISPDYSDAVFVLNSCTFYPNKIVFFITFKFDNALLKPLSKSVNVETAGCVSRLSPYNSR